VTHYTNSIAEAMSSKVRKLRRERERSVSTGVSILPVKRWPKQKSLQISATYQQWRCVSESDSCWQTVQCAFSVICSAVTQKPTWCSPSYNNNAMLKKLITVFKVQKLKAVTKIVM